MNSINLNGFNYSSRELKGKIATYGDPDVICLCETHLSVHEGIQYNGYRYYGNHRNTGAIQRSSGGVGVLVKDTMFVHYTVDVFCADTEGVIGVKFCHKTSGNEIDIVSNYLPPVGSRYCMDANVFFDRLLSISYEQCNSDLLVYCGDFNARIGNKQDVPFPEDNIIPRKHIDRNSNTHGVHFLNFLNDSCCCVLNGRFGDPKFTCCTTNGNSVVDYVVVPYEHLKRIEKFCVIDIEDIVDKEGLEPLVSPGSSTPDHNLLSFTIRGEGLHVEDFVRGLGTNVDAKSKSKRVPRIFKDGYMKNNRIRGALVNAICRRKVSKRKQILICAIKNCIA